MARIDDTQTNEKAAFVSEPMTGSSLHGAAFAGVIATLQSALALGVDPDALDPSGATALIVATTFDKPDAVKALLAAGATVDKSNRDGSTPLHMAALLCREEILETLLEYGADKSLRSKSGATALELVTVPFEEIRPLYDFLGSRLAPYGLVLDYARIQAQRPVIAALLSKS